MAEELLIEIKTTADVSGASQTAAALKTLGAATDKTATATKDHTAEAKESVSILDELGQRGSQTREAIEGLSTATQGGSNSIMGLAKAFRSIFAIISGANPLTKLAGLFVALLPIIWNVISSLTGFGNSAKDAGDKAGAAADKTTEAFRETKTAGEKLNELKFEAFKQELDEISQRASFIVTALNKIYEIQSKIAGKRMEVELATIEADPSLTPEQKKERSSEVRSRYGKEDERRADEQANDLLTVKENTANETLMKAAEAEVALQKQKERAAANVQAPADRAAVKKELEHQLSEVNREDYLLSQSEDAAVLPRRQALAKDRSGIENSLRYLKDRETAAQSPGAVKDAEIQKGNLAQDEAAAKDAAARARTAERELEEARQLRTIEEEKKPELRALGREKEQIEGRQLGREALGSVGRRIRETLGDTTFAPEQFNPRGYHDPGIMERDRRAVDQRNQRAESALPGAIAKAKDLADKLGDGKNDEAEAKELDQILSRIGNSIDANTRAQLTPLVQALRRFEQRLGVVESQTKNGPRN